MCYNNLDEESKKIKRSPKNLNIKLKPHQLTAIAAMREIEKNGNIIINSDSLYSDLSYNAQRNTSVKVHDEEPRTYILETNSAILGDKVGAGKSLTLLGLIATKINSETHNKFVVGTGNFSIKLVSDNDAMRTNLIIVPHNLIEQWRGFLNMSKLNSHVINTVEDMNDFTKTEYRYSMYYGVDVITYKKLSMKATKAVLNDKKEKKKIIKEDDVPKTKILYKFKINDITKCTKFLEDKDIILLNINRYKEFQNAVGGVTWSRLLVDEMDSIKLPVNFNELGNFNWFVTATPTGIHNGGRKYVSRLFGEERELLKHFFVKNNDEYVDKSMTMPAPHVFVIRTQTNRVVQAFAELIPKDVIKMINAGNMTEAVAKLNCNIETEDNLVEVLTKGLNNDLHNAEAELDYVKKMIPQDEDAHKKRIEGIEKYIKEIQTKLEFIDNKVTELKSDNCFICTEPFNVPTMLKCCKSTFCLGCLSESLALNNLCPFCRHKITSQSDFYIIDNKSKKSKKDKKKKQQECVKPFADMDKPEVLKELLTSISIYHEDKEPPRILIFSDFTQTFDKLINHLADVGLQYNTITGTAAHINNVITEYKEGKINVLLINSQHYGSGLNLECTDYVIVYHRSNKETEIQAIGRAQRYGRKKPLKCFYLVTDNENNTDFMIRNTIPINGVEDMEIVYNTKYVDLLESNEESNSDADIDSDNVQNDNNTNTEDDDTMSDEIIKKPKKKTNKRDKSSKNITKKSKKSKKKSIKQDESSEEIIKKKNKKSGKRNKTQKVKKNIIDDESLSEEIMKNKSKKNKSRKVKKIIITDDSSLSISFEDNELDIDSDDDVIIIDKKKKVTKRKKNGKK
jgi:hypothetical protein